MRFYKDIQDGFITAIGTGGGGAEITEAEYNAILAIIRDKPARTETSDYHLLEDLTWEEYERVEPSHDDNEATPEEVLEILLGGAND